jgi:hypothetical protein
MNLAQNIPRGIVSLSSVIALHQLTEEEKQQDLKSFERVFKQKEGGGGEGEEKTEKSAKFIFVLKTPIRTYYLLAKHEAAMNDWVQSIQLQCHSPNLILPTPATVYVETGEEAKLKEGEKVYLDYYVNGKKKSHKFKKSSIIIGRSSKADLILGKKRQHR